MAQTLTNFIVHVIFSTKNRSKDLSVDIRPRLYSYLTKILQNRGCRVYTINGGLDHVHALLRLPADKSPAELMRDAKAYSSKWIHREFPDKRDFAWQRGYAGFGVSYSNLDEVYRYIENQEDHHRSRSFEDELVSLLKRNELEYDENYLWR